jgi:hypothetical protein
MLKKSLISGSIVLLIVMLFALAGCEGPVGPAGPEGRPADPGGWGGVYLGSSTVTAIDLKEAFDVSDLVALETGVVEVYGTIPTGKTLRVLGNTKVLSSNLKFEDGAKLVIVEDASLEADGLDSGCLVPNAAAVIGGEGALILPYVVSGTFTEGFSYTSDEVRGVTRYVGSVSKDGKRLRLLSADIGSIFHEEDELIVQDIAALTADAIPAGKKLTLVGSGNGAGPLALAKGELVVAEKATLTVSSGTLTTGVGGKITNLGTIDLGTTGLADLGQGSFANNSVIKTATATPANLAALFKLSGSGKIESSGILGGALPAGLVFTAQKLCISAGSVTFPAEATPASPADTVGIYISEGAALILDAKSTSVGTKVENKGTIKTAALNTTALLGIFTSMENSGVVEAGAAVSNLDGDFTIPPLVTLDLKAQSTFKAGTAPASKVTVNGKLVLSHGSVNLQPAGEVVINGELEIKNAGGALTIADDKTITISGKVSGPGKIIYGGAKDGEKFIKLSESDAAAVYGLEANAAGLVCDNFNRAKELILETKALLEAKGEYEAAGPYKGPYIGIAQISAAAGTAQFHIIFDSAWDDSNNEFKFPIPTGMTVSVTGGGVTIADVASDLIETVDGVNRASFKLVVSGGFLSLSDAQWVGAGISPHNVATFTTLQFVHSNLIGPSVDPINIAFQTGRS